MKKIIVFGATGGTGAQVVKQALEKNYKVIVIVRNPNSFAVKHPNLKIVKGDVLDSISFQNELKNVDAVVSCLGIQKNVPTTVYSEGIKNIAIAMNNNSINRVICLSAGAVIVPPKTSFFMKFIIKNVLQRLFKHLYADMRIMENRISETNLNWTIIRPSWLRDSKFTGVYRTSINEHLQSPSKISRPDLAHYIVNHLFDEKTFQSRIEISY